MSDQRALERLHRAERALLRAGWTHSEGAQEWKPPLGTSASPLLDEIERLRAQLAAQIIIQRGWEDEARKAMSQVASARKALDWVDSWVCNPVGSYSVAALDGLFAMTRDRIAALSLTDDLRERPTRPPGVHTAYRVISDHLTKCDGKPTSDQVWAIANEIFDIAVASAYRKDEA